MGHRELLRKLKQWRRIATRYDKLAKTFMGFVKIVSIMLWLK
jgi:transposase